jgi:hypothetical protein
MGKNEKIEIYQFGANAGMRSMLEMLYKKLPAKEFAIVEGILRNEMPKFAESIPNIKFSVEHQKEFADKTSW